MAFRQKSVRIDWWAAGTVLRHFSLCFHSQKEATEVVVCSQSPLNLKGMTLRADFELTRKKVL